MIVDFDALTGLLQTVAMVDGAFDPLHAGHLEYFDEARRRLALPLLCNVASDRYICSKGRPPLLAEGDRARIIDSLRQISYTHINRFDTETVLEQLQPRYYVKGNDWKARGLPPRQVEICRRHHIDIVYLDTKTDSSTGILQRFIDEWIRLHPPL